MFPKVPFLDRFCSCCISETLNIEIHSYIRLFADDTMIYIIVDIPDVAAQIT